ncbi:MAG: hypothetical protein PF495_01440 [Spirochaetales bacterium]|jgi:hypothetical protein|nr:hypothetical protein [Spirochaetales bacterium]
MRPRKTDNNQLTINAFKQQKVVTFAALCVLLQLSGATVRRRLKEWKALSCYNQGGQYYTLPSIPEFNKQGLWKYKGAFFSKQGTMKDTVVHLVQISQRGLSNSELEEILGTNPNSYLPQCKRLAGVRREKHKRQVVYFSADEAVYQAQVKKRFPPEPAALKLPPDAQSIIILVELIKHPDSNPVELSQILQKMGHKIDVLVIENLFTCHGLKKTEYERVRVLTEIITRLTHHLESASLFPALPTVTFRPESNACPQCAARMKILKTTTKPVATLPIGDFIAREVKYTCSRCGLIVGSEELKQLVPERCNIGYDVLASVGQAFFIDSVDNEHIVESLREKHVTISRSEISYLAKKFIVYLSLLHKKVQKETRAFLSINGGYILHLDGTCDGDSPHLISVLDGITEIVLENTKVSTENADDLIPFLAGVKAAYGQPVAVVSDMGKGIALAVKEVFKNVPTFICHYHFLKAVGKNLFGEENDSIRKRLKNYGIQGILRKRVRTLGTTISATPPQMIMKFHRLFETEEVEIPCSSEGLPHLIIHTLLIWVLEGKHQGQGCGFPFDQPYLSFYQRLVTADTLLGKFGKADVCKTAKGKKLYTTIRRDLKPVIRDSAL